MEWESEAGKRILIHIHTVSEASIEQFTPVIASEKLFFKKPPRDTIARTKINDIFLNN